MKILVIGSGGREHAIVWKLARSKEVEKIYAAPGNGGTAAEKKCENVPIGENLLIQFARRAGIDLTVVGPEDPLAAGIVDRFRKAGLAIIGPDQRAARLEASKVYSKAFMKKYGVRAAESRDFRDPAGALACAKKHFQGGKKPVKAVPRTAKSAASASSGQTASAAAPPVPPLVIKADGLAAGKGVVIAKNFDEANKAISSFMKNRSLGDAGSSVVLENFLAGTEVSVLAAVSVGPGRKGSIRPFVPARDHKRRFDGGRGPNTGGMGAIAPVPDFSPEARRDFIKSILQPTLRGIEAEKMDYRGFIFFGLMVHQDRCSLLEYNVRLGDPETQAVLPLLDSDLSKLCLSILDGSLGAFPLKWKGGAVCAPVAVAEGYPGTYRKNDPIAINERNFAKTGAQLFIAGAQRGSGGAAGSGLRTSGGRVFAVSARGSDAEEARTKAYLAMEFISFEGMDYRKDIGREAPAENSND